MNHAVRYIYSILLVNARGRMGVTQARAAELCGISIRQYQKFEGGKALPRLDRAVHIAKVMHLSLDELVRLVCEHRAEEAAR